MKRIGTIVGVLVLLAGSVFALQGLNVLPGTFMRGSSQWLVIGLIMAVIGAGLIVVANRPAPKA